MKKKYEPPSSEVFTLNTVNCLLAESIRESIGGAKGMSGGSFGSRRKYFDEDEDEDEYYY